jgi:hypothetical protein
VGIRQKSYKSSSGKRKKIAGRDLQEGWKRLERALKESRKKFKKAANAYFSANTC